MIRLDSELVMRRLAPGRERAKEYIKSGKVSVNGVVQLKPSFEVLEDDAIICTAEEKYVGRGGLKLEKAMKFFDLSLSDAVCVDLGASTGGFTDCMLQNGAKKVYSIDVGHGQLAKKLIDDSRVVNIEGVNVKDVTPDTIGGVTPDFVCADLSFISVRYAAHAAYRLLGAGGRAVMLIKPQFEAGQHNISKGGIVKDKEVHKSVLSDTVNYISGIGFSVRSITFSPIRGGDGNIEYLALVVKESVSSAVLDYRQIVSDAFGSVKSDKEKSVKL